MNLTNKLTSNQMNLLTEMQLSIFYKLGHP